MTFFEELLAPLTYIAQPEKRIFWLYLLSSFFLAYGVLLFSGEKNIFRKLSDKKVWLHPSSRLDLKLFLTNSVVKSLFFAGVVMSSIYFATKTSIFFLDIFPDFEPVQWSYQTVALVYTLVSFIILDFTRFFVHYLMHKIPVLWKIHRVHHSARVLTPMTLYRTHPFESLISAIRRIVVIGFISGLFIFSTRSVIDGFDILGVNILSFGFNFLGSNLRHSHIWLSFGPLNYIFISPAQHQIHHSRDSKYYDTNMGITFAIWDQIFGTFCNPQKKEFLTFGIRGQEPGSLKAALLSPFRSR